MAQINRATTAPAALHRAKSDGSHFHGNDATSDGGVEHFDVYGEDTAIGLALQEETGATVAGFRYVE